MSLTVKQSAILKRCQMFGQITTAEAVDLVGDYYHNATKHTGDILSRMVKSGLLKREKPGLFKIGPGKTKSKPATEVAGQKEIFEI